MKILTQKKLENCVGGATDTSGYYGNETVADRSVTFDDDGNALTRRSLSDGITVLIPRS